MDNLLKKKNPRNKLLKNHNRSKQVLKFPNLHLPKGLLQLFSYLKWIFMNKLRKKTLVYSLQN